MISSPAARDDTQHWMSTRKIKYQFTQKATPAVSERTRKKKPSSCEKKKKKRERRKKEGKKKEKDMKTRPLGARRIARSPRSPSGEKRMRAKNDKCASFARMSRASRPIRKMDRGEMDPS